MSAPSIVPPDLRPAPRAALVVLYLSALMPVVGVPLAWMVERKLRRSFLTRGQHFGALEVRCHLRGALILGGVWSLAFVARHLMLDLILAI